jgi:hypothetical protein
MAKLNTRSTRPLVTSPVTSTGTTTINHQGGTGYLRDAKSELYLLALANMVGENTFYEKADRRDTRYAELIQKVALDDPAWVQGFLPWLRSEGFMRTAAVVGAAEVAKVLADAHRYDGIAEMIDGSLQRPDEVGEFLAYWFSIAGKAKPRRYTAVYKGLEAAIGRMYTERNWLKYDSAKNNVKFADALRIVHPSPLDQRQRELFGYILDHKSKGNEAPLPASLAMLRSERRWRSETQQVIDGTVADKHETLARLLDPAALKASGLTWEDVLSALGSKVNKSDLWQSMIPSMGYMALLRNLRNFDESGVPDESAELVSKKLADPAEVARSKQFPMRFYSAYQAAPSLRWGYPLEKALGHSLANVPELKGRTLILVDTSTSMKGAFSKDGSLMRWDAAALFGIALGQRCASADVVSFSSTQRYWNDLPGANTKDFPLKRGESLLRAVGRWKDGGWFLGGGTATALAVQEKFARHDRVVIITDEQADSAHGGDPTEQVPKNIPVYTWNLAGYQAGHGPSGKGNRHTFGGLTDAAFRMIPLLESGRNAHWPWMS